MEVEDKRSHLRHLRGYIVLGGRRLRRAACPRRGVHARDPSSYLPLLCSFLKVLLTRLKSEFALARFTHEAT